MTTLVCVDLDGTPRALLDALLPWTERLGGRFDLAHAGAWSADAAGEDASPALLWRLNHLDELERDARARLDALAALLPDAHRGQVRLLEGRALDALPGATAAYDLVVVGTHGRRGLSRVLLGSVAERVVRVSEAPVLVLRLQGGASLPARPRVVIPVDWPQAGPEALIETRRWLGEDVDLELVHVLPKPPSDGLQPAFQEVVDRARDRVRAGLRQLADDQGWPDARVHVVDGTGEHVGLDLTDVVERLAADVVVLATHGRTGLSRVMLGSVAERVVRLAPCPVLVTRKRDE